MHHKIKPIFEKIDVDVEGNAIYQIFANGINIGYKLIGLGEPLIMIMGLGNTMQRWPQKFLEPLAKKYQLILLDNRGVGYSSCDDKQFTYELFAKDIIALLDVLQVDKVNVFGISMGGGIALSMLLQFPDRINKAILCAASIEGKYVYSRIKDKVSKNLIDQKQLEATKKWKVSLDKLSHIFNSVMVVVGKKDKIVNIEDSKILASKIVYSKFVEFEKASHLLIDDVPFDLAKSIISFLG